MHKHGYHQSKCTPGFWTHAFCPTQFSLVVNDFGIKYVGNDKTEQLIKVLEEHYTLTRDWSGEKYVGLTMNLDHVKREVCLTMTGYVAKLLYCFQHNHTPKMQQKNHPYVPTNYWDKTKYATPLDDSKPLYR